MALAIASPPQQRREISRCSCSSIQDFPILHNTFRLTFSLKERSTQSRTQTALGGQGELCSPLDGLFQSQTRDAAVRFNSGHISPAPPRVMGRPAKLLP